MALPFDQDWFESLNAQSVERGSTVEQYRAFLNDFFENFPDLRSIAFDKALGAFDIGSIIVCDQSGNDERPVQFKRHGLGQTTLADFELRANHDNGASRIVDTLSQQVAAETAFFPFEHVAQRFEFAAPTAGECLATL